MAKARIQSPDGVDIHLEGTPDEIAGVLKQIKVQVKNEGSKKSEARKAAKVTVATLVEDLRSEQFFKKPKSLGDVKTRLSDMGHTYPTTGLSGPMQIEVKKKRLRRFKEKGKYVYAQ